MQSTARYRHYLTFPESGEGDILPPALHWLALGLLLLMANAPFDRLHALLPGIDGALIVHGKLAVFVGAFVTAVIPVLRSLRGARISRQTIGLALAVCAILVVLIVPHGVAVMGQDYARMSGHPFAEPFGWFYRRLLMPALAHLLLLDTPFRYYCFSLITTVALAVLAIAYIDSRLQPALPE